MLCERRSMSEWTGNQIRVISNTIHEKFFRNLILSQQWNNLHRCVLGTCSYPFSWLCSTTSSDLLQVNVQWYLSSLILHGDQPNEHLVTLGLTAAHRVLHGRGAGVVKQWVHAEGPWLLPQVRIIGQVRIWCSVPKEKYLFYFLIGEKNKQ